MEAQKNVRPFNARPHPVRIPWRGCGVKEAYSIVLMQMHANAPGGEAKQHRVRASSRKRTSRDGEGWNGGSRGIGTSGNGQKRGCNGIKRDTNENLPAAKSTGHVGTQ